MTQTSARRRDVQGLRAVAVGLVVADHAFGGPVGGFVGVDLFFVLSGFLITGLLVREQALTGRVSIPAFYARRVRRILPLALLALVTTALGARLLWSALRAHETVVDALWAAGFSANLHFSQLGTDYLAQDRPVSPVQHYWSLAVEEQFYVVWPVLLLVLVRVGARARFGVLLACTLGSFAWCLHLTATTPTQAYFSSPGRAWELGAGALLALGSEQVRRLSADVRGFLGWCGVLLLGFAVLETDPLTFPGAQAAVPVLAGVLLLAAGEGDHASWGVTRLLSTRPLNAIGDLSYALYLWHFPALVLGVTAIGGSTPDRVLLVGVALLLSVASHRWVEQPVLRSAWLLGRRSWRMPRRGLAPLTVGLAVAVVVGLTSPAPAAPVLAPVAAVVPSAQTSSAAAKALSSSITQALGATSWPRLSPTLEQAPTAKPTEFGSACADPSHLVNARCTWSLPGATKDAVVVGDSMATSWLPGLRQALEPRGYRVRTLTLSACPFADVDVVMHTQPKAAADCNASHAPAAQAIHDLRPDLVVISDIEIGILHLAGGRGPGAEATWAAGLARQIRALQAGGTRVVVLSPPPAGISVTRCSQDASPQSCVSTISQDWARKRAADSAAAQAVGAVYVDTSPWFCDPAGRCPIFVAGTPVRWDGYHLTAQYSRTLAPELGLAVLPGAAQPG